MDSILSANKLPGVVNFYIWGFIGLLVLVGLFTIGSFNKLVKQRNRLSEAWSGMDVQLKRRHDLVPNLVECVKGYRAHEQTVLENVTQARSRAQVAQGISGTGTAENELTHNLRSLFAVAEAYPELKATENFQRLSTSLIEIEDNIQYARAITTALSAITIRWCRAFLVSCLRGCSISRQRSFSRLKPPPNGWRRA